MDDGSPSIIGQGEPPREAKSARRATCVRHAHHHRGVCQFTGHLRASEHRHTVEVGAVLARVVVQSTDRFPLARLEPDGGEHLTRKSSCANQQQRPRCHVCPPKAVSIAHY